MKGYLTAEGGVVAWEVNSGGDPHHDEVSEFYCHEYVAKMAFDIRRNEMYVDTMAPAFSSIAQSAVRSFTGYSKDTSLLIESGTGRLRTTVDGYFAMLRHAPDPDDYENGEDDEDYEKDTTEYVDKINSTKTASELLGREKSYEEAEVDDPHVHLALNPEHEPFVFYNNCVNWPSNDVHREGGLTDMIDQAIDITRDTFLTHVDKDQMKEIENQLGYGPWLRMKNDYHVSYHRSKLHGKTVYFFKHSAIEYVFVNPRTFSMNPVEIKPESEYDQDQLAMGIKEEYEHTDDRRVASIIARQHLEEDPRYYTKLKAAGLNPPRFFDKVSFNMKGILKDGRVIAWTIDRRGNPHHLDIAKELGIDMSVTTQIVFERIYNGNGYVITAIGIILKDASYTKTEALDKAREIMEKFVVDLDGEDEVEVQWRSSENYGAWKSWQGRSRDIAPYAISSNPDRG